MIREAVAIGFTPLGLEYSPVKGPEGNIEFLLFLQKGAEAQCQVSEQIVDTVVTAAHADLGGNNA